MTNKKLAETLLLMSCGVFAFGMVTKSYGMLMASTIAMLVTGTWYIFARS